MLTITVDTVLGSALLPLNVNMVLLTVPGAISPLLSAFTLTGAFTLIHATLLNILHREMQSAMDYGFI